MPLSSTPSPPAPTPPWPHLSTDQIRTRLRADFHACRQQTLALAATLTNTERYRQAHPAFSPIGWHLGHIAFTEALWIGEHLGGEALLTSAQRRLFAADSLPKAERENVPDLPDLLAFLASVRDRTFTYLNTAPVVEELRLWRWLLHHESQHVETATFLLTLHRWPHPPTGLPTVPLPPDAPIGEVLTFAAGEGEIGCDGPEGSVFDHRPDALDNERPAHTVTVQPFELDATPVTVGQYLVFMAAGGYQNPQWWTTAGWDWVQATGIHQPLYWQGDLAGASGDGPKGSVFDHRHPVCGVSWYEAAAYARFVGKRLPTEVEWEWAARQAPLVGGVWEWTDSWFAGYANFAAFPYPGYSQVYFDGRHRVLRGASAATLPWVQRPSFRNWYHPHVRELFAGLRCARSLTL